MSCNQCAYWEHNDVPAQLSPDYGECTKTAECEGMILSEGGKLYTRFDFACIEITETRWTPKVVHLCKTCIFLFVSCKGNPEYIGENVVKCDSFRKAE